MADQSSEEEGFDGGSWFVSDANRNFPNSKPPQKLRQQRLSQLRCINLCYDISTPFDTHTTSEQVDDAAIESTASNPCPASIHPSFIDIIPVFLNCCRRCNLSSILCCQSSWPRAQTRPAESPHPWRTRSSVRRLASVECPRNQSSNPD